MLDNETQENNEGDGQASDAQELQKTAADRVREEEVRLSKEAAYTVWRPGVGSNPPDDPFEKPQSTEAAPAQDPGSQVTSGGEEGGAETSEPDPQHADQS